MKAVSLLGKPSPSASMDIKVAWLMNAVSKIADASREEGSTLADSFTVTPPATPNRTLDATTATLTQVREVLGTLLKDMQRHGPNQPQT